MPEVEVSLDDDLARLIQSGNLKEVEAINLQTLRECQRLSDVCESSKNSSTGDGQEPAVRYVVRRRRVGE